MAELHPAEQLRDIAVSTLDIAGSTDQAIDSFTYSDQSVKLLRDNVQETFIIAVTDDDKVATFEAAIHEPVDQSIGRLTDVETGLGVDVDTEKIDSFARYILGIIEV